MCPVLRNMPPSWNDLRPVAVGAGLILFAGLIANRMYGEEDTLPTEISETAIKIDENENDDDDIDEDLVQTDEALRILGMLPGAVCHDDEKERALALLNSQGPELRPRERHPIEDNEEVEETVRVERVSEAEEARRYFAAFGGDAFAAEPEDPFSVPTPITNEPVVHTCGRHPSPAPSHTSSSQPREKVSIQFEKY